jgi:hypothetical protein
MVLVWNNLFIFQSTFSANSQCQRVCELVFRILPISKTNRLGVFHLSATVTKNIHSSLEERIIFGMKFSNRTTYVTDFEQSTGNDKRQFHTLTYIYCTYVYCWRQMTFPIGFQPGIFRSLLFCRRS